MKDFRLAILASGNGSNAVAICQYFSSHAQIEVVLILSNNAEAGILKRARSLGVETFSFNREEFKEKGIVEMNLREKKVTHIVLAGFLWLVPLYLVKTFAGKIINIHPALLPKFGGKGMYGMHVHKAVKQAGDQQTGITIHQVNENFDEGAHLLQVSCLVEQDDSVEMIAAKVQALEHLHYPKTIEKWLLS